MSLHLAECFYYMDDFGDGERCICERLRSCEQRVRDEERERARQIAKEHLRTTAESFPDYDYYTFAREAYEDCYNKVATSLRDKNWSIA